MSVVLIGPLCGPQLMAALDLQGDAVVLRGELRGGKRAGIDRDDWPRLVEGDARLQGMKVEANAALQRYASVMGLHPVLHEGATVMGVSFKGEGPAWQVDDARDALAAEIARQILAAPGGIAASDGAARLPMTGVWAASRLRAQAMPPSGGDVVARRTRDSVTILDRHQPFLGFFGVEEQRLTYPLHAGGVSRPARREAFLMGDAVVLLPWDPVRDRVLVVEQFRFAAFLRGDPQPWLLEPIAGRVDAGEDVEAAILREAREEAALEIRRLIPCFQAYPSPGAVCEFIYHFIGIVDLPDDVAGIHGLDGEAEDIRGHLLDRAALSRMVDQGQLTDAPLIALSLWLDSRAARLRKEPEQA
ncbi:NUDIX domain-containing protein [Paracoccus sp. (in: a-proteobacteria)]|uniref:NUDIX domain-containing protein n=1 Tax=Paracoccus sp. TaxID=267 RepID=UPI00396CB60B